VYIFLSTTAALVKVAVMKHYHQVFSLKSLQSRSSHLFGRCWFYSPFFGFSLYFSLVLSLSRFAFSQVKGKKD
jgi:hypothetical protein